jgi:hypothetical protein
MIDVTRPVLLAIAPGWPGMGMIFQAGGEDFDRLFPIDLIPGSSPPKTGIRCTCTRNSRHLVNGRG